MSIKSDKWIRRMAIEHQMIVPFEEGQVREGVISYGLSSYGYDIRVANEFKIFTNVNCSIVDPKNFDQQSFVDFKGDVCIVPPNSFALARTIEHFKIPRSVLTLCLGKSTYARCFRGDTRVALLDGTAPTLEDLAARAEKGEMFWGYSVGRHGRMIATLLEAPRYVGRDTLMEIILDNRAVIRCTPDHEFILRDGRSITANELRPGYSLMPLYRQVFRGYEMIYQPINGHLHPTHRLADEWNVRNGMYPDAPGTHRHHRDRDRRNNIPWNIERQPAGEHIRLHNLDTYGEDFDSSEHGRAIRDAFSRLAGDDTWREHYSREQSKRALLFWHEAGYIESRARLSEKHRANWTEERRTLQREAMQRYYGSMASRVRASDNSRAAWIRDDGGRRDRQREIARNIRIREGITAEIVREALDRTGSIRGAGRLLDCDRTVFRRFPDVIADFRGTRRLNHKVESIRDLAGDHDVYCLTVPEAGNFALEAGVFVSNCGIIVNVTPFEPEWEGFATLEISNTTPLPAKIYANEGIAQVVFFESDDPCAVSYADKKGKYQAQRDITLPRI